MKILDRLGRLRRPAPVVAVLRLNGVIGASGRFGGGLNDQDLAPLIERAFAGKVAAVALSINSPGGSPVQSSLIAARISRLAAEKKVKVYAFTEDVAASGGYWLACAGEEIWVDRSSIIGSIGVIYAGFGFHEFLAKQGVERRVHTAGESKSMLDPFKPENPEDVARIKALQEQIHDTFKDHVRAARGDRLTRQDLFTGDVWVGQGAIETGLADGIGHLVPKMKEIFGDKVRFRVIARKKSLLQRMGAPSGAEIASVIEERSLWARYGL